VRLVCIPLVSVWRAEDILDIYGQWAAEL